MLAITVIAAVLMLTSMPAGARADGDPASDVLAGQSLFLPQDGGIPVTEQQRLVALTRSAEREAFPLRIALIATPGDLGSVTELWRMPASYARFLGQELSLVYRGTLLVVMPDGIGVYRTAGLTTAERSSLRGLARPGTGAALGAAALTAAQRLAAASGHRLALVAVTSRPAAGSSPLGGLAGWVALALGGVLIALAWTVSLRARSPRLAGPARSDG